MQLFSLALIIALVAFMESISMAKAMAAKSKQRVNPNQELIGQGVANIGAFTRLLQCPLARHLCSNIGADRSNALLGFSIARHKRAWLDRRYAPACPAFYVKTRRHNWPGS